MDNLVKNKTKLLALVLMAIGIILLCIKGFTGDYVDAAGILHEYFFLIPVSFACLAAGMISLVISFIKQ